MNRDGGPILVVDHVTKSFGNTVALREVSLEVLAGEVHALLGHNGSGKSTLIKILSGYHRPDSGRVSLNGREVTYPTDALALRQQGVSFMHQDIGLVPTMSVLENLRIAHFTTGALRQIRWNHERRHVRDLLDSFGLDLSPDLPVGWLSAAERAVVGVLRAVQDLPEASHGLVVLDEPTAALPAAETQMLFDTIRDVARRHMGVLFVTHHINEALQVADRASVLRDGALIATRDVEELDESRLTELVIGRRITSSHGAGRPASGHPSAPALEVRHLSGEVVQSVSFLVQRGEILGLTGSMGAGHQEIPFLLYGAVPARSGTVLIGGQPQRPNPVSSRHAGVAMISGDRARAGGVLTASLSENMSLPILDRLTGPVGWIHSVREEMTVKDMLRRFRILGTPSAPFSTLSGGNQQKALIARWLESDPEILLLQEPTSGVDIGAVDEICSMLRTFAASGGTVIWSSEQYEDVASLSHRVLVFSDGHVVADLAGDGIDAAQILTSCNQNHTIGGGSL